MIQTKGRMRPTFLLETNKSAQNVIECIRAAIDNSPDQYHAQFAGLHAMISIGEAKRKFWSPCLHLEVREDSGQRQVFGRFSPHPSIWTGFMFTYLVLGVLVFFLIVFGISQWMLGNWPWAFYLIFAVFFLAALLWFASQTGQKLAHSEMEQMQQIVEECIGS